MKQLFKRILLALMVLLLTVFFVDWCLGRWAPSPGSKFERKFPRGIMRHPYPYVMFKGAPGGIDKNTRTKKILGFQDGEHLNELGYRGKLPLMPKKESEFRVLMLGGSTLVHGAPPLPVILEKRLFEELDRPVSVYSMGVISSVSGMDLSRLVHEMGDWDIDVVVLYNGGNDIYHPWCWDPRPGNPFNFIVYENNPILDRDLNSYPAFPLLFYGSYICRFLGSQYFWRTFVDIDSLRREVGYGTKEWQAQIARTYVNNSEKAIYISRGLGSKCIVFFQPMVFFKDLLSSTEKSFANGAMGEHCLSVRELIRSDIERRKMFVKSNIVDLSDVFDPFSGRTMFVDVIHITQEAQSVIADEMASEILKKVFGQESARGQK